MYGTFQFPCCYCNLIFVSFKQIFQDQLSTAIIKSLIPLQNVVEKHTKLQKMCYNVERKITKGSERISSVKTEVKNVLHLGIPHEHIVKYSPDSDETPTNTLDALNNLQSLLSPPRRRRQSVPSYVKCYQIGTRGLREITQNEEYFNFPEADEFKEEMFHLVGHNYNFTHA